MVAVNGTPAVAGGKAAAGIDISTAADGTATGDPGVIHGFRLGWHVAELYGHTVAATPARIGLPDDLPGIGDLSPVLKARLIWAQIVVNVRALDELCSAAGVKLPSLGELEKELDRDDPRQQQVREGILALHEGLLTNLTAAEFSVGKAYGLGRALADTTLRPAIARPLLFTQEFERHRIANLCGSLDDLDSMFPRYAADAVRDSLLGWSDWIAKPEVDATPVSLADQTVTQVLRDQGRIWRALLSGEREPQDLLTSKHYIAAAINLVDQMGDLVWQFVRSSMRVLVPAGLVLALVLAAMFVFLTGGSEAAGAIAAVIAGIGVSWKAVGSTLGKALGRAEEPVWRSEIGASVAVATNRLDELERRIRKNRKKAAEAAKRVG